MFNSIQAQIVTKNDRIIDLDALPYYHYGKGFGWTTPDSLYQLNLHFRMQNKVSYYKSEGESSSYDATIRRLRLRFDGFVGDPKIVYAVQLALSPDDIGSFEEGEKVNILKDAVIFYNPNKQWSIGFGQTKLPGNRQRVNSSGALQLTDRSINDSRFNIDRDFGLHINYSDKINNMIPYALKSAISTGQGAAYSRKSTKGLAFTGKAELYPFGEFINKGAYFEGDSKHETEFKLLVSAAYHYNSKAQKTRGISGSELFEDRDIQNLFLDAIAKYKGWSFQTAYMKRMANDPITINPDDSSETAYVFTGEGFDAQLSYTFKSAYEVIGRFSNQTPHEDIADLTPRTQQLSAGLTKYIWEHKLKLQTEVTHSQLRFSDASTDSNWYLSFQVEIGI